MKVIALSLAVLVGYSSCASMSKKSGQEALLFNPAVSGQSLEVSVMSNGCTKAEHFYLKVKEELIELRRTEPDLCRAAPTLVRLAFEYPFEAGVYRFKNKTRFSNRTVR